MKARRIDFSPDEFLAGVDAMALHEIGLYWLICSKIYSRGAGLPDNDRENARIFRQDPRTWKRLKAALITKGKIEIEAGHIINRRCLAELVKARKRIDDARRAGQEGGRPSGASSAEDQPDLSPTVTPIIGEPLPQPSANRRQTDENKSDRDLNGNNGVGKATGLFSQNPTINHQPPTTNHHTYTAAEIETRFSTFWRFFPNRAPHSNPRKYAREKFERLLRGGVDPALIIAGAKGYAVYVDRFIGEKRMIKQAVTWLNAELWTQYANQPVVDEPRAGMV